MKEIVLPLVIGVAAGVSGGIFGIGGGVLIVPALIGMMGYSQFRAQGTSLVALLAPVGMLALIEYYRKGEADFRVGLLIAGGFLVGGFFGSRFALSFSEITMQRSFAVFLGAVAVWLFLKK
jgi:uncharacterized membrane protein YfcA